ncbi:hypothetical protein AB0A74_01285 [Saccharothrix sp. NPDC042600]|uniref:hypothetical protein n=1 Tax=Saccharothrix TaxID=2071 RepID=UPI00340C93BF|nr:hypothetical protein GCM10017745_49660 [Saccharothrix mutabilis subsp. capreolus]
MQGRSGRRGVIVAVAVVLAGVAVTPHLLGARSPVAGRSVAADGSAVRLVRAPFDRHEFGGSTPDGLADRTTATAAPASQEPREPASTEPEPVNPPAPEQAPAEPPPAPEYEAPPEPAPVEPEVDDWMAVFNEMAGSLPGYYLVEDKGMWGATQLSSGTVYIARRTPLVHLRSVMLHEAAHVLQGRRFGGYYEAQDALAAYGGIEVTADCKALEWGATWVHYGCTAAGREGASLF